MPSIENANEILTSPRTKNAVIKDCSHISEHFCLPGIAVDTSVMSPTDMIGFYFATLFQMNY